jgi:hypothetical protein
MRVVWPSLQVGCLVGEEEKGMAKPAGGLPGW